MTALEFDAVDVGGDDRQPELSPAEASLLAPDHPFLAAGRWRGFAVERGGTLVARAVASVDPRQRSRAGSVGCLGFIRCADEEAVGSPVEGTRMPQPADAVREVLWSGIGWLRSQGVATVRCPVQLSTWFGHRAMTGGFPGAGSPARFSFEPPADSALPEVLAAEGFVPAHRAVSCLIDSSVVAATTDRAVARFTAAGLRDRPIELADLEGELRLLHRLAVDSFRGAWGLSDCTFEEFASIYRPLADDLDPGFVRLLQDGDGRPIGFALGFSAGPADAGAGGGARTFVLKSIGLTADARSQHPGLGAAFAGMVHRAALERGHEAGVHAFMAEGSAAHRTSLHWGRPIRQYATYERAAGR